MPWNNNIAQWADQTLSGIKLNLDKPLLYDEDIQKTLDANQRRLNAGLMFKNNLGNLAGIASGIASGPIGWVGLGVKALGDNIRAAKSQFDLAGFKDQLNASNADFLQAAGSSNTTSDLLGLSSMVPDYSDYIDNQGYKWDGNPLNFIGSIIGNRRTENQKQLARNYQAGTSGMLSGAILNAQNRVSTNTYRQGMANFLNNAAMGGPLSTHGSDFTDDLIRIDAGGSHEQNPFGGVPAGVDPQGIPNLVEEGETIWDDYVFSRRLKAPKSLVKKLGLGGGKDGMSYAEASKRISEKSGAVLRPNDPISKRTKEAQLAELEESQEEKRMKIEQRKLINALKSLSPDDIQGLMAQPAGMEAGMEPQLPPQGVVEEPMMAEPVQGTGEYEPIGYAAFGGFLPKFGDVNLFENGSKRRVGTPKDAKSDRWSTYTLPGVQKFFNDLIAEYDKAPDEATKQAIRQRAIDTVNKIQSGYRDIYNEFNGNTARYSDAVKAHQQAFQDAGGNYGFAGGNGIPTIDDVLSYNYTGHTTDNAKGKFSPDGLYGWRTALRHFGSNNPLGAESSAALAALANKLNLDWAPTMEYGNDGYKLYTLSPRQAAEVSQPVAVPGEPAVVSDPTKAPAPETPVGQAGVKAVAPNPKFDYLSTWMRYAPIIGSGLSVLGNVFSNPDYSEYDNLLAQARSLGRPVTIPVETIGNKIRRNPIDERLAVNQANQNFLASLRGTADISGGNRAYRQFGNNLLAYNNQGALSDIASKAYLANRQDALQTADFNRATDLYNMNAINQRNLTQAQLNSNRQHAGFNALLGARQLYDNARRWDDQFIDADLTGLFQGLGDLGREREQRNWLTSLAENGVFNIMHTPGGRMVYVPSEGIPVNTGKCGGKMKTKKRRF